MSSIFKKIIFAFVLALCLRACVFETFKVSGTAMAPAVFPNDTVIASKVSYGVRVPGSGELLVQWSDIQPGDLVVVSGVGDPPMTLLRRIAAVGESEVSVSGEIIRVSPIEKGKALPGIPPTDCNVKPDTEPHCLQKLAGTEFLVHPVARLPNGRIDTKIHPNSEASLKMEDGFVYVVADDRRDGPDSRHFGPVHMNKIVGKVSRLWIPARDFPKIEVNKSVKARLKNRTYFGPL